MVQLGRVIYVKPGVGSEASQGSDVILVASRGPSPTPPQTTSPPIPTTPEPPSVPPTPEQTEPANGAVLTAYPRIATFRWQPVEFPGGVTYTVEIEWNTSKWIPCDSATGLSVTEFTTSCFGGDNPFRWRVWATSPTAGDSQKSGWWTGSFDTG